MTIIDAHQHVWDPARAAYAWLGPDLAPINRAIEFDELLPLLAATGVTQHGARPVGGQRRGHATTCSRSRRPTPRSPRSSAGCRSTIRPASRRGCPSLRGQPGRSRASATSSTRSRIRTGCCGRTSTRRWACWPPQARAVRRRVRPAAASRARARSWRDRHPDLRMVIDHLSKPPIGVGDDEPWLGLHRPGRGEPQRLREGVRALSGGRRPGRVDGRRRPALPAPRARAVRARTG